MRKKTIVSAILASSLAAAATFGGCTLVSTNAQADLDQDIAKVNITGTKEFDEEFSKYFNEADFAEYKKNVETVTIKKRELVSYFINVGYSYIQSGYSYENTFNMLVNSLTNTAVLTQYATTYMLAEKVKEDKAALSVFYDKEKTEAEKYEYLLGGANSKDVKLAKYGLYSSINNALDSYEEAIIDEDNGTSGSEETRATPGNVDTETENFYPKKKNSNGKYIDENGNVTEDEDKAALDYFVYTGFYFALGNNYLLENSGDYQKDAVEGGDRSTRVRAYNRFIGNLISYNLIDVEKESVRDILSLGYMQDQYVSQLKNRVVNKYYEMYEEAEDAKLKDETSEDRFGYIDYVYNDLVRAQEKSYATESAFASAIGNMSDTSFVLYAPETENGGRFGFVYNILLPFSSSQSAYLTAYQSDYADADANGGYSPKYYIQRNKLLKNIKTTDQRTVWFNGQTEYAFKADEGMEYYNGGDSNRSWLFFENNVKDGEHLRYEKLSKYDGRYSFNGTAVKKDDKYALMANKLTIDDMLKEFSAYINYVLGTDNSVSFDEGYSAATWENTAGYYDRTDFFKKTDGGENELDENKKELMDYGKFIYASGNVSFGADNTDGKALRGNIFNADSSQYKALSAVNELQYAYTTDTSVLSQYIGYSVEAGDTSYIKEFEYAAHEALNKGAGSFVVCAGDYGWHLIYVTYTFDEVGGKQYEPDWNNVTKEGTFENLFYEWIKSNDIADISSTRRTQIISRYNIEETVETFEKAYKDLLGMDVNNNTNNGSSN